VTVSRTSLITDDGSKGQRLYDWLFTETVTKLVSEVRDNLKRLKWFLWHGNVFRALQTIEGIIMDLETVHPDDQPSKLLTATREFDTYLRANAGTIPNYGERYRAGETISSSPAESLVNQVISKPIDRTTRRHAELVPVTVGP
jgi:hypothetical protein